MRTSARISGAAAVAAAVALLVSGCGSDGGDDKGGEKEKPEAAPSATKTPSPKEEAGGKAALPGVWQAKADGKPLVLTVVGENASLVRDKKACTGHVMKTGGKSSVMVKCPGGTGEERTNGEVGALTAKTMNITWNGGATDTFVKAADAPAKLPKDPNQIPGLKDKLKKITEEPGKVRELPAS
ncbi:hypothetical protein GCM10009801_31580 [Streptomyces albiaxialis]|uniref:Lipoprotein n=1 Tax=Streptomyces albiaxialis TaxID=329523 RepID=A0ABN2W1B3_9ACTN